MKKNYYTKKELLESKQTLNENWIENSLMVAGFVPVIGEVADIALIIYYLIKGEKLYAALMLIALIPTVGDFIVKPIIKALKVSKEGNLLMKGGIEISEYLVKHPEMAKNFQSLSKYAKTPEITKTVENISKINSSWGSSLKNILDKIGGTTIKGIKSGGESVIAGQKFGRGLKDYFQGQRLSKYFAKHGVLPETGIQKWWTNVLARQDRRNSFRKFIGANNLLDYFGIPSLTTFERKLSTDPDFRKKIAEDPKTSDYIAQNFEDNDMVTNTPQQTSDVNDLFNEPMSLNLLKTFAQRL